MSTRARHPQLIWIQLIVGAIAVSVLLAGVIYRKELLGIFTDAGGGDSGTGYGRLPLVATAEVRLRHAEHRIPATGTLEASEAVTITARARGRVAEIRFGEGDAVAAGDVLVRLDRIRAEARVDEAHARVAQTRGDVERLRELRTREFVSVAELERAEAAAQTAAATLTRTEEDLRDRDIKAPFAGVIGRRMVSPGALLEPGTPVADLRRIDPLDLLLDVPETVLGSIERGQRVHARTPALPGERFTGELTLVGTAVDRATRTLPLEATFANRDGRLKPGMFLQAELITGAGRLLSVPEAAVIARGPTQHVFVLEESDAGAANDRTALPYDSNNPTVRRQPVETGIRRDGWVEVTAGLEVGQRIVVAGLQGLRDGDEVRIEGSNAPGLGIDRAPAERAETTAAAAGNERVMDDVASDAGPDTGSESGSDPETINRTGDP
jgi:membrane fusion protein (multidrug efflux system)